MAKLVFSSLAYADSADILTFLMTESGRHTAVKFDRQFEQLFDRLADFPQSGAPRPAIGHGIRIGIVAPNVVIYRYSAANETVTVLRIVHGRRKISGTLLDRRND